MIKVNFETYIEDDLGVNVSAIFIPGHSGSFWKKNGDPGDPPEPAEIEITNIITFDGENGENVDYDSLSQYDKNRLDDIVMEKAQTIED